MEMTNYTRKIDASGRLVIPVKLREEMRIEVGDEYPFFVHEEGEKTFLCIECYKKETELQRAKRLLEEAGFTVEK